MEFFNENSGFLVDDVNKRSPTPPCPPLKKITYRLTVTDSPVSRKAIHQIAGNKYEMMSNVFGKEDDVILEEVNKLINDRSNILTKNLKIKRFNQKHFWIYFVHPNCLLF